MSAKLGEGFADMHCAGASEQITNDDTEDLQLDRRKVWTDCLCYWQELSENNGWLHLLKHL